MQEVVKEKKINVVFFKNAVAADSPYVTDINNDIIEKIKK
jgi:Skp family chaperone for outer membrane proteins